MDQSYSRLHLVDVLAAGAAGAGKLHFNIRWIYFKFALFSDRQHGDRSGGGMDATIFFGSRNALNTMHSGFKPEKPVTVPTVDLESCFFVAAGGTPRFVHFFPLPAFESGVLFIHFGKLLGKKRRLFPAGTCTDLKHQFVWRIFFFDFFDGKDLIHLGYHRYLLLSYF